MKGFTIIAACDARSGIGKNNDLPWKLSADMKHFRDCTMARHDRGEAQNVLIMVRRTWESLPEQRKPLHGRHNVVLSTGELSGLPSSVDHCRSLNDAVMRYCADEGHRYGRVFVIGGEQLYRCAIQHPSCEALYLTMIESVYDCDRYFPPIPSAFREIARTAPMIENGLTFFFSEFKRDIP